MVERLVWVQKAAGSNPVTLIRSVWGILVHMAVVVEDYLIDLAGIDWSKALSTWSWLLPAELTVWLVNRFGDMFLVFADGAVHMLDVGSGSLERITDSRDDFCAKIDEEDNAAIWLMIPLVDRLVGAGVALSPGQCYGFLTPPVLGGQYSKENVRPILLSDYIRAYGSIHSQLHDVPEGTQVVLKVPGAQGPRRRASF